MLTRRHIRRATIWVGLAVGVAGLAIYFFSFFGTVALVTQSRSISAGRGVLTLGTSQLGGSEPGVHFAKSPGWLWTPRFARDPWDSDRHLARIPGWLLVGVGLIAFYRWLPSTYPTGRCARCGYDRSGLTAATPCPECGTAIIQPPAPRA